MGEWHDVDEYPNSAARKAYGLTLTSGLKVRQMDQLSGCDLRALAHTIRHQTPDGDLLSYAIGRELFGDIRFDACGSVDISFSGFRIAAAQFGNPTGIQSGGMFGVDPKRRVVVCNGFSYRTNL